MARPSASQSSIEPPPTLVAVVAAAAQLEQQRKKTAAEVSLLNLRNEVTGWRGMATRIFWGRVTDRRLVG